MSNGKFLSLFTKDTSKQRESIIEKSQATLEARFIKAEPQRLIGDRAYDSDGLDRELKAQGVTGILCFHLAISLDRQAQEPFTMVHESHRSRQTTKHRPLW